MAETKLFGLTINLPEFGKKKGSAVNVEEVSEEEIKNFRPSIPRVNLLPATVTEGYRVVAMRNKFLMAGAVLLMVLGLGYAGTLLLSAQAEERLQAVEQENVSLSTELQELSIYKAYVDGVDAKRNSLFEQFSGSIQYPQLAQWVNDAADSSGVDVSDFSFGSAEGSAGSCSSPDPFNPSASIGCITITGTADSVQSVVEFTNELNERPEFVNPYFPTVTVSDESINLTGSVGFTQGATTVPYPDMAVSILDLIDPSTGADSAPDDGEAASDITDSTTETGGE